ncbi:hypothetical protein M2163_006958 [Streptomyces sp. SAI-135]|nr:hypothetical protein [Streptomyces sp. SAI-135]
MTTERMPVPLRRGTAPGTADRSSWTAAHAGGAVAAGASLDGHAREALAGGGQAGGGADLQLRLVVGREEQEGGVAVEHVARAFDRALEQSVEVVRGGGADEHLEGVGALAVDGGGRVGGGDAQRRLEYGAFVVSHQEADRGGLAAGVADAQVGGVDRGDAAVGCPDAVAALPAGQLQCLGDPGAGARGVRPGREVGEGFADDLFGGVAEEFLGVLVPRGDGARTVDLDDGDADAAVGQREEVRGQRGTCRAGAHRPFGQVELEPDLLVGGGVLDAPAGGECGAELEAAAALAVEAAHVDGLALEGDLPLGVVVGHLDPYAVVAAQAQDVGGGARVDHGIGDEFAGEDHRVVDDVGEAPALEGVPDEGAGGRDRSSEGFEASGRARGDHRTPRPVVDVQGCLADRLVPLMRQTARRPGIRVLSPGDQSGGHVCGRPPMPARARATAQAGQDRLGWTAACKVTYLRRPCGCRSAVFPSGGCADDVRSCRTVMAGFNRGETLGKLLKKVRAGRVACAYGGQQPVVRLCMPG